MNWVYLRCYSYENTSTDVINVITGHFKTGDKCPILEWPPRYYQIMDKSIVFRALKDPRCKLEKFYLNQCIILKQVGRNFCKHLCYIFSINWLISLLTGWLVELLIDWWIDWSTIILGRVLRLFRRGNSQQHIIKGKQETQPLRSNQQIGN